MTLSAGSGVSSRFLTLALSFWLAAQASAGPIDEAYQRVVAAAGDPPRVGAFPDIDPWLTVEFLSVLGRQRCAETLAASIKSDALARYLRGRVPSDGDASVLRSLRRADEKRHQDNPARALEILESVQAREGTVLAVEVAWCRARCLKDMGKVAEADRHSVLAARRAARFGWKSRRNDCLRWLAPRYCLSPSTLPRTAARTMVIRRELRDNETLVLLGDAQETVLAVILTQGASEYIPLCQTDALQRACNGLSDVGPETPIREMLSPLADAFGAIDLADGAYVYLAPFGALSLVPFPLLFPKQRTACMPDGAWLAKYRRERPRQGKGMLVIGRRGGGVDLSASTELAIDRTPVWHMKQVWSSKQWRVIHLDCPVRDSFKLMMGESEIWPSDLRDAPIMADLVMLLGDRTGAPFNPRSDSPANWGTHVLGHSSGAIVSLWDIDRDAAEEFAKELYRQWLGSDDEIDVLAAVERARDAVRSKAKWRHPYYWAGWRLWGSP